MTITAPGWGLCDEYRAARDTLATRITLGQVVTRSTLEQELCNTLNGLTALTVCHLGGRAVGLARMVRSLGAATRPVEV